MHGLASVDKTARVVCPEGAGQRAACGSLIALSERNIMPAYFDHAARES